MKLNTLIPLVLNSCICAAAGGVMIGVILRMIGPHELNGWLSEWAVVILCVGGACAAVLGTVVGVKLLKGGGT